VKNNSAWFTNYKTIIQNIQLSAVLLPYNYTLPDPKLCGIPWFTVFTKFFNGSLVAVATECIAGEGYYDPYSWIAIGVAVDVYTSYYLNCTNLTNQLGSYILNITGPNLEVFRSFCEETNYPYPTTTATRTTRTTTSITTTATAPMKAVGLFVLVVSLLASFLM